MSRHPGGWKDLSIKRQEQRRVHTAIVGRASRQIASPLEPDEEGDQVFERIQTRVRADAQARIRVDHRREERLEAAAGRYENPWDDPTLPDTEEGRQWAAARR